MTMTAVQILGLILVVGGISVLLGAAVGYYTGYSDALREHFRSELPDAPEGTRALAPVMHTGGTGYIDFDGGADGNTVVTLRVVEDARGSVTLQVTLWGEVALEVEQ